MPSSLQRIPFNGFGSTQAPPMYTHDRPTMQCKYFQRGHCLHGNSCRYLHDARDGGSSRIPGNLIPDASEIDKWFASLLEKNVSEHDIIYSLTSPQGYEDFLNVLNHPCLCGPRLHRLVRLLTRPKLCHSLLKQATDKIYKALSGSHFLNAIHRHILSWVSQKVDHIQPYVLLSEEIMGRTAEGWKEVPLDELSTLVHKLDGDSVHDLRNNLTRLLNHRDQKSKIEHEIQKKRLEVGDESTENFSLGSSNFRDMAIIPSKEQFLSGGYSHQLPVNQVCFPYPDVHVYLETQFRLMQEDCIAPLRDGIHGLLANSKADSNIHIYTNVHLESLQCGHDGMISRISFDANTIQPIDWQSAKRLRFGSLLCMSCDKFQTIVWAVVANRTEEQLSKNMVNIQILEGSEQTVLQRGDVYVMVESAAYFEPYSHILRTLQRPEMDKLPFQEHLIALEPHVKEPAYLKERNGQDIYDFERAFPQMTNDLPTTQFHILQTWPEWGNSLDESQMFALKHGLTKGLALIQGPPGSGKTFIGTLIVRILLSNLKYGPLRPPGLLQKQTINNLQEECLSCSTSTCLPRPPPEQKKQKKDTWGGPILVICSTNHALDQFLEGIYAYEKNIVRIGSRSKSSKLEPRNSHKVLYRDRQSLAPLLQDEQSRISKQRQDLEEQILDCANVVEVKYVTKDMLNEIATEEQVNSLFFRGCDVETVVKEWLDEKDNITRKDQVQFSAAAIDVLETEAVTDVVGESLGAVTITSSTRALHAKAEDSSLQARPRAMCTLKYSKNTKISSGFDIYQEVEDRDKDDVECNRDEQGVVWKRAGNRNPPEAVNTDVASTGSTRDENSNILCSNKFDKKRPEDGMKMVEACERADLAWTGVNPRTCKPNLKTKECSTTEMTGQKENFPLKENIELLQQCSDVWSLDSKSRRALHTFWVNTIRRKAQEKIDGLYMQYTETCQQKQEIDNEILLVSLRKAKVVGMTTSVAAKHHSVLESLQAEIIVVEEAAKVLESHIVACLTGSTKHLVLIGDHLQLRPQVAVHNLAVKHKLNVSMFERLIEGGVEYATLGVQRRMRPEISRLIAAIYPELKDHESVSERPDIKGMKSNVFFLHHTNPEEHYGDDDSGRVNIVEAQLVVELCSYLLKQQYSYSDVTILSMYRGQIQEISKRLEQKLQASPGNDQSNLPRVSSVDEFQGKECKIIILSLVRNNLVQTAGAPGKIGFLAESSRMCVALSRAQDGLFMFGNGDLLCENSEQWKGVVEKLQQSNSYGDALVLTCQNHPHIEVKIQEPSDFQKVPDGGCDEACDHQLDCGHVCPNRCHPGPHEKIVCPKHCPRKLPRCGHQCQSLCHGFRDCPPCGERVTKKLPDCGHSVEVSCSTNIGSVVCQNPCLKVLDCSHKCQKKCGEQCTTSCDQLVEQALPCSHFATLPCHENPSTHLCQHPCQQVLPECQHSCQGTCSTCKQGQTHIPCQQKCDRSLPCGHPCASDCHQVCPPCSKPCQKRCPHSRCRKQCGYPCIPCMEPCLWKCKHHACKMLCHQICDRSCCDERCQESLPCGHRCLGFCGEPCPTICRLCTPDFVDTISQLSMGEFEESDKFVKLQDCGHVFEVSGLDEWMKSEESKSGAKGISPKKCFECGTPVTWSLRYGGLVKSKLQQIEEEKKRILESSIKNAGIELLRQNPGI